MNKSERLK